MRYTPEKGADLVYLFQKTGFPDAKLIGSLGRGKESNNDIDILLPGRRKTVSLVNKLKFILEPKGKVVPTDWGGLYFYNTHFGNVDIFFTTKDFDY